MQGPKEPSKESRQAHSSTLGFFHALSAPTLQFQPRQHELGGSEWIRTLRNN